METYPYYCSYVCHGCQVHGTHSSRTIQNLLAFLVKVVEYKDYLRVQKAHQKDADNPPGTHSSAEKN